MFHRSVASRSLSGAMHFFQSGKTAACDFDFLRASSSGKNAECSNAESCRVMVCRFSELSSAQCLQANENEEKEKSRNEAQVQTLANQNEEQREEDVAILATKIANEIMNRPRFETYLNRSSARAISKNVAAEAVKAMENDAAKAFRFFLWIVAVKGLDIKWPLQDEIVAILRKGGRFDVAWEILSEIAGENAEHERLYAKLRIEIFRVLIKAYSRSLMAEKAIEAFERMENEFKIKPDSAIYNAILNVLVRTGALDLAMLVYRGRMMKDKCRPSMGTFKILLEGCCKRGKLTDALQLFDEMSAKEIHPDVMSYTILLDGLCKSGMLEEARKLFLAMKQSRCGYDRVALNVMVNGFCIAGKLDRALELLEALQNEDLTSGSTSDITPNEVTFTALLNGLIRAGRINKALDHWRACWMDSGIPPGLVSLTLITNALFNSGRFNDAISLINMLEDCILPDTFFYNTLIRGLCQQGFLDEAHSYKFKMQHKGCLPDVDTYNILIHGMCKYGLVDDANRLFQEMKVQKVRPNILTYNSLLYGLCEVGQVDKALVLFYQMEIGEHPSFFLGMVRGAEPITDGAGFQALSRRLVDSGKILKAYKLVRRLIDSGVVPDVSTFNILMRGLCKVNKIDQALKLLKLMLLRGHAADTAIYSTLIHGLWRANRDEDAYVLFEQISRKESCSSTVAYKLLVTLMTSLCDKGDMERAFRFWTSYISHTANFDSDKMNQVLTLIKDENFEKAFEILLKIHVELNHADATTYSIIIKGFCKKKKFHTVLKLLALVELNGVILMKSLYPLLIHSFCDDERPMIGFHVFKDSVRRGFSLKYHSVSKLLYSLLDQDRVEEGKQLIKEMLNSDYCTYPSRMVKEGLL